jgi:RNA polymerase sigma factor (TIGR02999 family)
MAANPGDLTVLLQQLPRASGEARDRIAAVLYPELKKIARRQFRNERPGHVIQPTALVNEAYVQLVAEAAHTWQNRAHFFATAADVMRHILVDYARARQARKRGGDLPRLPLDQVDVGVDPAGVELLDLDAALSELEAVSERQARIVSLRYFAGLSVAEIAEALAVNSRTVDRDWSAARVWLRRRLRPE